MPRKRKKMRGLVQKVIQPMHTSDTEKAQIVINEADDLYRELRVENALTDDSGRETRLKAGEEVDVTLEADTDSGTE